MKNTLTNTLKKIIIGGAALSILIVGAGVSFAQSAPTPTSQAKSAAKMTRQAERGDKLKQKENRLATREEIKAYRLDNSKLTAAQKTALSESKRLREANDLVGAKQVLVNAGIIIPGSRFLATPNAQ